MNNLDKEILRPNKPGQIVKFHTPYPGEDPNQLYLLLEIFDYGDGRKSAATIKALIKGWSFLPINKVFLEDLELAEVITTDLIGFRGALLTENGIKITGDILAVDRNKQPVELNKLEDRVNSNVRVSIRDAGGSIYQGDLTVIF